MIFIQFGQCVEIASKGAELARKANNPDIEFHCLGESGRSHQMLQQWSQALTVRLIPNVE